MTISTVNEYSIRPEKFGEFEEIVGRVVKAAAADEKTQHWAAYQTAFGPLGTLRIVTQSANWAEQAKLEIPAALVRRLLGETKGRELNLAAQACLLGGRVTIRHDRPELSYPAPDGTRKPFTMVTRLQAIPGGEEAVEEVLRKLAEAIPKVDDPRRFTTLQTDYGDLSEYVTVTGLDSPAQLDAMMQPMELLNRAFGHAEGGLIARAGLSAMRSRVRELVVRRDDLSHMA